MNFASKLYSMIPNKGEIGIFWMGQAGFLIKNSYREVMAIDAYLSNLTEKRDGLKRIMMSIIRPDEVKADIVLASHHHTDHLDLDSLPDMMKDADVLYCCKQSAALCQDMDIAPEKIQIASVGERLDYKHFVIEAVFADHGDYAPDALGFIIQTDGIKVYFTGDTSYQAERMRHATDQDIDILIVPINGEYGNMNERDAVMLAEQTKAKITIPCHFWLFARHKGSPYEFETEMQLRCPALKSYTMCQGEFMSYFKKNP